MSSIAKRIEYRKIRKKEIKWQNNVKTDENKKKKEAGYKEGYRRATCLVISLSTQGKTRTCTKDKN